MKVKTFHIKLLKQYVLEKSTKQTENQDSKIKKLLATRGVAIVG